MNSLSSTSHSIFEEDSQNILSQDSIRKENLKYRHGVHRKNGLPESKLRPDDYYQTFYPKQSGILRYKERAIRMIIDSYVNIVPDNIDKYRADMERIFALLKTKSVVFVTNHATFAGIPILICELIRYAVLFGYDETLEHIYTILGSSLMTQSHKEIILALSHVLKTQPGTRNMPPLDQKVIAKQQGKFCRKALHFSQDPGNIFCIAIGSERDVLEFNGDGTAETIYSKQDQDIDTSIRFVKLVERQGNVVVLIGINESNLKNATYVEEKNNDWVPGNVYVSLQILDSGDFSELATRGEVMSTLGSHVKNKDMESIGRTLPLDEFYARKDAGPSVHPLDSGERLPLDMQDTVVKETTRRLLSLLANRVK